MIIVKLMGGLGNQMFQYAAGRSLALRKNVSLKLDLSFLEGDQTGNTRRCFELDSFTIDAQRASFWEVAMMTDKKVSFLYNVFFWLLGKKKRNIRYVEPFLRYDFNQLPLPDNAYLEGYWQSEKYFSDDQEAIRRDFTLKMPLLGKNLEFAARIGAVNSISLHVRRGDYVSNPVTNAFHGICGEDYYNRAVMYVAQRTIDPVFFVFSDDPVWCRHNLQIPFLVEYVDYNGDKAHEDLRLMSLCKHHIIANSSFSWWGAWLCLNTDKLVVAPRCWFSDPKIDTDDLIPAGWHRI